MRLDRLRKQVAIHPPGEPPLPSARGNFVRSVPGRSVTLLSPPPGPTHHISQVYETPVYVYGEERPDLPQLFLKDGPVLNVTDYWLVDDQLHFAMIEEVGTKPAEHVIPFDALDLQTTVDANTRKGFRFMLRNEPFEQYLHDHPEGWPPAVTPPHE